MKIIEQAERKLEWPPYMDPVSQAQLWTPMNLYPWQAAILRDCMKLGARVAAVTPNESGKTSTVIPALGLGWMAAFPGSQVVSTSGVERQISEQLWPVLRASLGKYPRWTITQDELTIKAPSVRGLPPSTWKAFTTKDPQNAEGFHDRFYQDETGATVYAPLLVIIDEAKSFDDPEMFFAFRRCGPAAWLVVSTPGEDRGPFWNCFNQWRPEWQCHEIGWTDCPHLLQGHKYEERLALIRQYGEDDPYIQSMIFGKFFRKGGRLLFDRWDHVEYAMSGIIPWLKGERRGAADLSLGGDEAVFGVRDGNTVLDLVGFRHKDSTLLVKDLIACFERWSLRPWQIVADAGGLGAPIIDQIAASWGPINRYLGNAAPRDKTAFMDRASEDAFALRQILAERRAALPRDDTLREQMRRRQYDRKNDNSNRVKLESKEEIRRRGEQSPDRLDCLTMLFADMPATAAVEINRPMGSLRCGMARDCFQPLEGREAIWGTHRFED